MGSLKRILIELVASFGGIGTASTGGLPGTPTDREEKETIWLDWGGSHLDIPEIKQSQQAFEQGDSARAYKHLCKALESPEPKPSLFEAQLFNNLAVSAYNSGLIAEAQGYITRAAEVETGSQELSDAIVDNKAIIMG
jgi:hypothetical protein